MLLLKLKKKMLCLSRNGQSSQDFEAWPPFLMDSAFGTVPPPIPPSFTAFVRVLMNASRSLVRKMPPQVLNKL